MEQKKKIGKVYASSIRYDAENTRQIKMKLNLKTDKDILKKLDSVPNKQGYIKMLIRKDMANEHRGSISEKVDNWTAP